jgi:FkbM family methyltransferase
MDIVRSLQPNLTIFDVGSRSDSEFTRYSGIVHYFEPVPEFISALEKQTTKNTRSFYNPFGLSEHAALLEYYPAHQSFHNRVVSVGKDDSANKKILRVESAKQYISEHSLQKIDFVKIDTEGHEFSVLKGFGDALSIVDTIQFEYGGTYKDTGIKLREVINYLREHGFSNFSYVAPGGVVPISDFTDHYQYCNILCKRSV